MASRDPREWTIAYAGCGCVVFRGASAGIYADRGVWDPFEFQRDRGREECEYKYCTEVWEAIMDAFDTLPALPCADLNPKPKTPKPQNPKTPIFIK